MNNFDKRRYENNIALFYYMSNMLNKVSIEEFINITFPNNNLICSDIKDEINEDFIGEMQEVIESNKAIRFAQFLYGMMGWEIVKRGEENPKTDYFYEEPWETLERIWHKAYKD